MTNTKPQSDHRNKHPNYKRKRNNNNKRRRSRTNRSNVKRLNQLQSLLSPPPNYPKTVPKASSIRRQHLSKKNTQILFTYLSKLPEKMVRALYKSTGGQPSRIDSFDRIVQLTIKALGQENRLTSLVKGLNTTEKNSLISIVQSGGIAHCSEFLDELQKAYGGSQQNWKQALRQLGQLGLLAKSPNKEGFFFYLIPEPLIPFLEHALSDELKISPFEHSDVQTPEKHEFDVPFEFSLVSLATYIEQKRPRLTQQQDIHRQDKDDLNKFFSQLWAADSHIFDFHLGFLLQHEMLDFQNSEISVVQDVVSEWLTLPQLDRNALILAEIEQRFSLVEWIFWILNDSKGKWLPEHPLLSLYRRWNKGDQWRQKFYSDDWSPQDIDKSTYSFAPLLSLGLVEMGTWGQERFYRLTEKAKLLINPTKMETFNKFYLTPNFEIVAPVGTEGKILHALGELTDFHSCDRANTFKLTVQSINRAQKNGWQKNSILSFLRQSSQIGLPENIEFTLQKWIGSQPDIEFHDVMMITVPKYKIKQFESSRELKSFIVHRFTAGMYAIDPRRKEEFEKELTKIEISHGNKIYQYTPENYSRRNKLHELLQEAKEQQLSLVDLAQAADTQPEDILYIDDTEKLLKKQNHHINPKLARQICDQAIRAGESLRMLYHTKSNEDQWLTVNPVRLAQSPSGYIVLIGKEEGKPQSFSFPLHQILQVESIGSNF